MSPNQYFRDVPSDILSRCIASGHTGRFQPALVLLLSVSRGLQRPTEAQMSPISVFGMSQSDNIVIYHCWGRWTLPTCSNMAHTTSIPTIVCLIWPLETPTSPNEPESVFSGCPQSDVIVVDRFWGRWTLTTCFNMPHTPFVRTIVCLVWPLKASRGPQRPKMSPNECFRMILS